MPLISPDMACEKLRQEQVVALPTETVYGLAASLDSEEGLKKIFTTKQRPFFDPLIVHVGGIEQAHTYATIDPISDQLMREFWPGPLTVVVPRKATVPDLITNGADSVALRSPNHPVFLEVLKKTETALAAPSANRFGRTSPTTAQHVIDEFNNTVNVLDGGPCQGGIESTVVCYKQEQQKLLVYRPGALSLEQLHQWADKLETNIEVEISESPVAPGQLQNHYQPDIPFLLVEGSAPQRGQLINDKGCSHYQLWTLPDDPVIAARKLYSQLREFSKNKTPIQIHLKNEWLDDLAWKGILDRLRKASHYQMQAKQGHWVWSEKTAQSTE